MMGTLRSIIAEIVGLFVDDGSLALRLLGWSAIVGSAVRIWPDALPLVLGAALALGYIAILLANVARAARSLANGRR